MAPLAMFSINTLKEITSIEQLSMFVIRMRDVYVISCFGNAALQADCFNPCYWPAVCAAERSKRTLASGLPITRTPDLEQFFAADIQITHPNV